MTDADFLSALQALRAKGQPFFICLGGSEDAKALWLANGGTPSLLLDQQQIAAWLAAGTPDLSAEHAFYGSFREFLSLFDAKGTGEVSANRLIAGGVLEYRENEWNGFTCRIARLSCCMGPYFSAVNQKELSLQP